MAKRSGYILYVNKNGDYTLAWISRRKWRMFYNEYGASDHAGPLLEGDARWAVRRAVLGREYPFNPDKKLGLVAYVHTLQEGSKVLDKLRFKRPFPYTEVDPAKVGMLTVKYFKLFCEIYKRDLEQFERSGHLIKSAEDVYNDFISRYWKWYHEADAAWREWQRERAKLIKQLHEEKGF